MNVLGRRVENEEALVNKGDFCWQYDTILLFCCPNCGALHMVHVGDDGYSWNGDRDKPTLTPSIFFRGGHSGTLGTVEKQRGPLGFDTPEQRTPEQRACRWHGYLTNGEWKSV